MNANQSVSPEATLTGWVTVLILAAILMTAAGVTAVENRLNGGFEEWETLKTVPPGWDLTDGETGKPPADPAIRIAEHDFRLLRVAPGE